MDGRIHRGLPDRFYIFYCNYVIQRPNGMHLGARYSTLRYAVYSAFWVSYVPACLGKRDFRAGGVFSTPELHPVTIYKMKDVSIPRIDHQVMGIFPLREHPLGSSTDFCFGREFYRLYVN